jgi:integrase
MGGAQLRIPTVEETKTILETLRGSIAEGPAMLAAGCGLRLGEAIALRWTDVGLERRRVRVTATMYQDGRTEPKSARSRRTAERSRSRRAAGGRSQCRSSSGSTYGRTSWRRASIVCARWRGLRRTTCSTAEGGVPMLLLSVSHRFSKCADAIGLGDVRFHDLRHAMPPGCSSVCIRTSSARRWVTPRSRSPWTPTATSYRACRRWRPTPSTRYSASDGGNLAATKRLRSSGLGRFRC